VADALESLAQVVQVVEKLSAVLEKIAEVLRRIATALTTATEALTVLLRGVDKGAGQINEDIKILRLVKPIGGRTNIINAIFPGGVAAEAGLGWKAAYQGSRIAASVAESEVISKTVHYGTGGEVTIPGVGTELLHAGESAKHMVDDASTAQHEAG